MNKKGVGIFGVILIVAIGMFIYWLITTSLETDECRKDSDCASGYYCGSDFSCHEFKTIEKTVIQYNLLWPSVILSFAIIAAAFVLRWKKN